VPPLGFEPTSRANSPVCFHSTASPTMMYIPPRIKVPGRVQHSRVWQGKGIGKGRARKDGAAVFFLWQPQSRNRMTIPIQRYFSRRMFKFWCGFRHLKKLGRVKHSRVWQGMALKDGSGYGTACHESVSQGRGRVRHGKNRIRQGRGMV
jgi:hypothetical protein